jgi:hypothetical protein
MNDVRTHDPARMALPDRHRGPGLHRFYRADEYHQRICGI